VQGLSLAKPTPLHQIHYQQPTNSALHTEPTATVPQYSGTSTGGTALLAGLFHRNLDCHVLSAGTLPACFLSSVGKGANGEGIDHPDIQHSPFQFPDVLRGFLSRRHRQEEDLHHQCL
jgi:hypothetical protein